MTTDGFLPGEMSWELKITVTNLSVIRSLRVKGDLHIGGLMLKLVEDLDILADWSDHALWWPQKNMWLTHTRSTLNQYGVQADAVLHFTPMHKILRLQMPDLRYKDMRVNFSVKVFKTVINICKELGIRHPEEMSLCRPMTQEGLKRNRRGSFHRGNAVHDVVDRHKLPANATHMSGNSTHLSDNSLDRSLHNSRSHTPILTPVTTPGSTGSWKVNYGNSPYNGSFNGTFNSVDGLNGADMSLAISPNPLSPESKMSIVRPKNFVEKARMNVAWLDSSLSLMEQYVKENDVILLRFKFFSFFDLNAKYDAVRINQIYEQAKWALLSEETDCTEEEMMMFAALHLQVNMQREDPMISHNGTNEDDIEEALKDLQVTLEGSSVTSSPGDITQIPELVDNLRFMKPKRFTLRAFKRYYFTFKDTSLAYYKSKSDIGRDTSNIINLRGSEVTPEVNISQSKYSIKLEVPGPDGMSEMWIRCDSEQQYAKWMAACRLAAKGKTMADSSYESEVSTIEQFLKMQHPAPTPSINPSRVDIDPEDYVAQRFLKKMKGRQICGCVCCPYSEKTLVTRILEAHANVKDQSAMDAKMNFIKAWQALPDFGVTLFVVKFNNQKKEELLGVACNRLMRMDLHSGDHLKTWRYNTMQAWNVNWETKEVIVQFEEERVAFGCLSSDCKTVHEFIGGYIFLLMRSKDQNQTLNEELFHKLTGGWV